MELFKRLTLITLDGRIEKVFYPVFPPDRNADEVLAWLRKNAQPGSQTDASTLGLPMTRRSFAVAAFVSLLVTGPAANAADLEQSCKILLDRALPVWTMASASEDVKAFAAAELRADPLKIRGDFDGDGREDIALLIQDRAHPVFEEPARINATRVAVCLARSPSMVLRLIEKPYCDDFIYLVSKGEKMYDIEAGNLGTYPVDAIGTTCFEKAGAVFFLDGNAFRRIINSD